MLSLLLVGARLPRSSSYPHFSIALHDRTFSLYPLPQAVVLCSNKPKLHGFRRSVALNMLSSGVDIFVLQRLMGHADLQVLRRYLAQNDEDNKLVHMRGDPVDNHL